MTQTTPRTSLCLVADCLHLTIDPLQKTASLHFTAQATRNAISGAMAAALAELVTEAHNPTSTHPFAQAIADQSILALLLRSELEGVFLAGGDLNAVNAFTAEEGELFISRMRTFADFLRRGPLVSISLLNGVAAGGGSEIALATDIRVALNSQVRIDLAQTRWGVPAGWGMMDDLRARGVFGSERRRGLAMMAQERWSLAQLERMGLIDLRLDERSAPESDWFAWLQNFISRISDCPASLRAALLLQRPHLPGDALADFDKTLFSQHWLGEEHRKRVAQYLEMRVAQQSKGTHS